MRCLKTILLSALLAAPSLHTFAETNLPLGLPADQTVPTRLDGYKLVSLDRSKEIVFDVEGKRVTVEVPLFIYLPESDKAAEMRDGLKAIHGDLARLASEREPVDPQRLMTIFLALDGLLSKPDPVALTPKDVKPAPAPQSPTATKEAPAPSPLTTAIARTNG